MNSIHHHCVVQVTILSSIDTLHYQVTRLLDSYLAAWTMDKVAMHGVYRWHPAPSCNSLCPQYLNVASLALESFDFTYNYSRYVFRIEAEVRGNANMKVQHLLIYILYIALHSKSGFQTECAHITNEIMPGIQRLLPANHLTMYTR